MQVLTTVGAIVLVLALVLLVRVATGPQDAPTSAEPGQPTRAASTTAAPVPGQRTQPARDPASGLPWVALDTLPREAARTVALIEAGGPFPYAKDGAKFGNRERILPRQRSGYYREYTVPTPGSRDRGPRRIVSGDAGELFWTADHYASFSRIRR